MTQPNGMSRRQLLQNSGRVAAATALASVAVPQVHAASTDTIQVALVGCGGRGTGAASDAMSVPDGRVKLVAMADAFEDRLSRSYQAIKQRFNDKVDVPAARKFVGFDAYKSAMDSLKAGDVVILTTPPAFRHVMFKYAIEKGLNVFMEKPIAVDGPTSRKMLALGEEAKKKDLKVGVGLMCRHCHARGELFDRIQDGQMGDLVLLEAYRVTGPTGSAFCGPKPDGMNELEYQIRNFHAFLWASGGAFSDFLIHNIDECCWMKNDWPVKAEGYGGRHYRGDYVDQNFDTYSVEYTFADGTKLLLYGRGMPGCSNRFASFAHGSKGSAIVSKSGHYPAHSAIYKGHNFDKKELAWEFGKGRGEPNPYQVEWVDLVDAIRNNKPYNEVERGAKASLVTAMGRLACHTGNAVTFDEALNHEHEFAPGVADLTVGGPAPLVAKDGRYPVPQPGINKKTEY